jgi:two-component system, cell cycle response regulator
MRIVLVEPSRTASKLIATMLAPAHDVVRRFADGRDALNYLKSDLTIDALITAGEAGSLSGPQLCAEVRACARGKRAIFLLLMSCNSEDQRLVNALDVGADEFIRKPPGRDELHARLRAAERCLLQERELIHLANTDLLTGLANRRSFFSTAEAIMSRAQMVSAVLFDIDRFKSVNDEFGHDVGDEVLKMVGSIVQREELTVGRLGGEEFAIVLEGKDVSAAFGLAEALRVSISKGEIQIDKKHLSVTCSFGVSERLPNENIDHLLKRADIALYAAKTNGRNCVCIARSDSRSERPKDSVIRSVTRDHPWGPWWLSHAGQISAGGPGPGSRLELLLPERWAQCGDLIAASHSAVRDLLSHPVSSLSRLMWALILRKNFPRERSPDKFKGFPEEMAVRPSQVRASAAESAVMIPLLILWRSITGCRCPSQSLQGQR